MPVPLAGRHRFPDMSQNLYTFWVVATRSPGENAFRSPNVVHNLKSGTARSG
jgi:hypothetical protein